MELLRKLNIFKEKIFNKKKKININQLFEEIILGEDENEIDIKNNFINSHSLDREYPNSINPYIALNVLSVNYSKTELLQIVRDRISIIKLDNLDKDKQNNEINQVLDAYNTICKCKKIIKSKEKKLIYK